MNGDAIEKAAKAFGPYTLSAFILVGIWLYVDRQGERQAANALRDDAREGRLLTLLEDQHASYVQSVGSRLVNLDRVLARMDERAEALVPTIVLLSRSLGLDIDAQALENEKQKEMGPQ